MAINQDKLRMLRIMQILMQETDEQHPLSAAKIMLKLNQVYGMTCDRKTVYSDIELLDEIGLEVAHTPSKKGGFYVASRQFELPELKLLVDAVQASKFITVKKSEELIRKIGNLTSIGEASILKRQVFIYNRPKTGNEHIYYNVDAIHNAIFENKKISFQYTGWNTKKELEVKKNGRAFVVSPHALTWDNENYYLVAYHDYFKNINHYRVDKMKGITLLDEKREGTEEFAHFNLAEYAKKTFGMYSGHDEMLTLRCSNQIVGVLLDRFGTDLSIIPVDNGHFRTRVLVSVSVQFFGWLTGIGKEVQIDGPESVRKEYQDYLKEILDAMGK